MYGFVFLFQVALISCFGIAQNNGQQCFEAGECTNSDHIKGVITNDEYECLTECQKDFNCTWFSYYPSSRFCHLLETCVNLETTFCPNCISGEDECVPKEPECFITGECVGEFLHLEEEIFSAEDCLSVCKKTDHCHWFTYFQSSFTCLMFVDCETIDESCDECVSGEKRCKFGDTDPEWHMIIGGQGEGESTVELYNWQTGQQCQIGDLPYGVREHSATVLENTPVFCGGRTGYNTILKSCYKYRKDIGEWEPLFDLLAPTYYAGNVVVPNHGWLLYGGVEDVAFKTAQTLTSLDSTWEIGPNLYANNKDYYTCIVQLNDTLTGFFGGKNNPTRVITFDWTTMQYTLHQEEFHRSRSWASCALLRDINHEPIVAVAGGKSAGMEFWYAKDDVIRSATEDFPPSTQQSPLLVSVKGATELIFYEATGPKGIWKYTQFDNSWTKLGDMLFYRDNSVVLPVNGITCPVE